MSYIFSFSHAESKKKNFYKKHHHFIKFALMVEITHQHTQIQT